MTSEMIRDVLDLPLDTKGLRVGQGVKTKPRGDSVALDLPLATSGLSVGVGNVKMGPSAATAPGLDLPLATKGLSVGVGLIKQ